ncbi:MAG TPA: acetoacetate decarboxylase family protein [Candidatus Sulfotelmatobacter sp.]|nr:acetoacetate decarboxylase family protein [Candidatus Sulfotelmatobacter sp.]
MPLYGTLDTASVAPRLPVLGNLDTEAWLLPQAEILQLAFETPLATLSLLPRAMHPAVPPYIILSVIRYPESPVGVFNLAMLRLSSRAGAHPRGFVLGAVASSPAAAKALRAGWAFPVEAGEVTFTRRHDRVMATAARAGRCILDCALVDPEPISSGDVQYINWVTMGTAPLDGKSGPLLIQVDPRHTIHKAERGRPEVAHFDPAAWNAPSARLLNPIVATVCTSDTDLPRIRFVMDPEIPVFKGTKRIRESREAE